MNLSINPEELRPVITAIVAEVLAQTSALGDARLAFTEPEAAGLLGIKPHALRDARLRQEIRATKIGGRIGYSRDELLAYLSRQQL